MPRGAALKKKNIYFWKKKKVRNMTLGKVMGKKPVAAGEMVGKIWVVIKKYKIQKKKKKKE